MTDEKLKLAVDEIKEHRQDIIAKLVMFSKTDSLLFWGKDDELAAKQEQLWTPILIWAGKALHADYKTTDGLQTVEQSKTALTGMQNFMENMSDKELAAFYLASMNTKSELLAAALVKGHINAEQAFNAACLEELYQAEKWGHDKFADSRRETLKNELCDIEKFLQK